MTKPEDSIYLAEKETLGMVKGLTKREHFALEVLSAFCSNSSLGTVNNLTIEQAVRAADALIAELNKEKK